ncbi:MAG: hypothetical protein ACQKBY_10965, partial [Verrucomicrobiales bacterium]
PKVQAPAPVSPYPDGIVPNPKQKKIASALVVDTSPPKPPAPAEPVAAVEPPAPAPKPVAPPKVTYPEGVVPNPKQKEILQALRVIIPTTAPDTTPPPSVDPLPQSEDNGLNFVTPDTTGNLVGDEEKRSVTPPAIAPEAPAGDDNSVLTSPTEHEE